MKDLNQLVMQLQDILGSRLKSIFVFGSQANTNEAVLKNNVDLFIILDTLKSDDLTALYPLTKAWIALDNPCPMVMGKEEFTAMADVFAIEYTDMKWNYQVIYGSDLLNDINVNYFDLRLQCERELKSLILRVRNFYLENGRSRSAILRAVDNIARTVVVIFRALLRLKNISPSVYKHDVVEQLGSVMKFDKVFFRKLIELKEGTYSLTTAEVLEFNEYLLNQLSVLLKQLSDM